jgi:serine/threonine-protein kinase RsbW
MEELDKVQEVVGRAVKDSGFDDEQGYWVELAIMEAMINAIRHGNGLNPAKTAALLLSSNEGCIDVTIEDEGGGFNLGASPDPTAEENLLKPGGRGLAIIRSVMEDVVVSPCHRGTRLQMTKRVAPQ